MINHLKPLGFVGIGLMGNSLVKRLIEKEYTVNIFDKNKNNLKNLMNKKRISLSTSPAKLSQNCEIIFICVDKTESIEDVVFKESGIIKNASKTTILVDLSTTLANKTVNFSNKLRTQKGASWIDAPMSGGPDKALDGSLALMIGGEKRIVKKVSPILKNISSNFTYFGPTGSGQIVKMINQILVLNNYTILAEALSFAEAWGIDAKKIPDALRDGHAGSNLLKHLFPRMINRDFKPQGYTSQILKDLTMVSELGDKKNIPLPMTNLTKQLFTILSENSKENLDGTSIIKLFNKDDKF